MGYQITKGGKWLILCLIFLGSHKLQAQNIEVEIKGIRSDEGQIVLAIYTDEESYDDEKPVSERFIDKGGMKDGQLTVELDLKEGTYGLTLIDDENRNGKMDYKLIRATKEGFGFSNFFLSKLKKPSFDDFKFEVKQGQHQKVEMKVKYMLDR
ncbi:MAG: DUF2141 domain-containing protein [Bacteroidales bacterium]